MKFNYNKEKDAILRSERGIGFDDAIVEFEEKRILNIIKHHNTEKYPNQKFAFIKLNDYVHVVPFVIEEDGSWFLKTIFPDRKLNKKYS